MEIQTMFEQMKGHVNVTTVSLLVLFIVSEILGSNDKIKASSIYGLLMALFATIKDQVWPMAVKSDPVQVVKVQPEVPVTPSSPAPVSTQTPV